MGQRGNLAGRVWFTFAWCFFGDFGFQGPLGFLPTIFRGVQLTPTRVMDRWSAAAVALLYPQAPESPRLAWNDPPSEPHRRLRY